MAHPYGLDCRVQRSRGASASPMVLRTRAPTLSIGLFGTRPICQARSAAVRHDLTAVVVDIACQCGDHHPSAPEDTTGCGAGFRVELALG